MWNGLTFLINTATGLGRAHETSLALQSVTKLARINQLVSILQGIPLIEPVIRPLGRLIPVKVKSPVTSNIVPNIDPEDGLADIAAVFSNTDSISQAVLRAGNSSALQNEAAYFLYHIIPVLNAIQLLTEILGIYFVLCFVINTLFFIRNSKEGTRPIIFSFTSFREKAIVYFPYAFFQPSYKLTITYRWYKLLLAFIILCLVSLGPECLSLTVFAGIRGVSALDLQLALSHLMLKTSASASLASLSGTLFSQFIPTDKIPVGIFKRVRNWSKWVLGIGVPLLAIAKKSGSGSSPGSESNTPDFESGGPHPNIATATATATPAATESIQTPSISRPRFRQRGRMAQPVEPPVVEQIIPPEDSPLGFDDTFGTGPGAGRDPFDGDGYL